MSTLTTLVEYLRELLGDEGARQDFRLDSKGHLKAQGFEDVSEPELREAVSLVGTDHGNDPGFGDLSAGATNFDSPNGGGLGGPIASPLGGVGDDATAANQAANTNASDGDAAILTGNAQAVGNVAETNIAQSGPTFGSGGGIYIGDQEANVTNIGAATADTGNNVAVGNASDNDATSAESAVAGGGFGGVGDDATATNVAANSNASDGTAVIETGNASAVGNVAETNIAQSGPTFGSGGGIYIGDQEANVTNVGSATATTGGNVAVGNASDNDATSAQSAVAGGGFGGVGDDATAVNSAENRNASDGAAAVATGNAQAIGNVSETNIAQSGPTFGSGGGIYIGDQEANVTNIGSATATTGGNVAVGNASDNDATSFQNADAGGGFGGIGDDASAVNAASNANVSDGTAGIATGNASAVGNVAETNIAQSGPEGSFGIHLSDDGPKFGTGSGIYIGDQEANVTNIGTATATTGGNVAVGNASDNDATSFQNADAGGGFGGVGDDATAVNTASNTNASDGTALVDTGDADGAGNMAETDIAQLDGDL